MSELKTMSFELNQTQLDAAIAAAMPALIAGLAIKYTSGRAPKGVVADVTLSESLIRDAVIAHTKKLVNPSFTHFSVSFRATRGEDGLTTQISASSEEILPEADEDEADTLVPNATTAAALAAAVAGEVTSAATVEAAIEHLNDGEADEAPFVVTDALADEAEAPAPVEDVEAPAEVAVTEEAPKAAGRSRLFADLARPNNAE
jgi:hypothetical protein